MAVEPFDDLRGLDRLQISAKLRARARARAGDARQLDRALVSGVGLHERERDRVADEARPLEMMTSGQARAGAGGAPALGDDAAPFDPGSRQLAGAKPAKQRRAIADSSDDDEALARRPSRRSSGAPSSSDSDDAPAAPPPRPATARPATISQDDAPRPAARKPAAAGDAPPAMKKQSGYLHHNAQNRELARAMVESDPATAGLGAQERNQAVMKKLAAMWGELDAAQKQAFADDAPLVAVEAAQGEEGRREARRAGEAAGAEAAAPRAETDE